MLNLSRLIYDSMFLGIQKVVANLSTDTSIAVQNLSEYYCNDFEDEFRSLMALFNASCRLLIESDLVKSAKISNIIIPQVELAGCKLVGLLIDMHNSHIVSQDEELSKKYFSDIQRDANARLKSVKSLCGRLIRASNFLDEHYVYSLVVVRSIMHFSERIKYTIMASIEHQARRLFYKKEGLIPRDPVTFGIKYSNLIRNSCGMVIPDFNVNKYFEEVKNSVRCSTLVEQYHSFLLVRLKEECGFDFECLIDCIAKASLITSGGETFAPETEVLVTSQNMIKVINNVTHTECIYNCNDGSIVVGDLSVSRSKRKAVVPLHGFKSKRYVNIAPYIPTNNHTGQQFL
ncbi:hypothetical protein K6025_05055 [Ehrlichia sp. JZT12]